MTTLQKILLTATVTILVAAGIHEHRAASHFHDQAQTLQQQQSSLQVEIQRLQQEHDDTAGRLKTVSAENERLRSNQPAAELLTLRGKVTQLQVEEKDPVNSEAKDWLAKVDKLKQRLAASPEAGIPELQFATYDDWLNAVRNGLNTEIDYRKALAAVRSEAQFKFAEVLHHALVKYADANNRQFPSSVAQLQPYFDSPVDGAMLDRWQIVSGKDVPFGGTAITQKTTPDELFDSRNEIGLQGYSGNSDFLALESDQMLGPVYQAFKDANNGNGPRKVEQLIPFTTTQEEVALVNKMMERDAFNALNLNK